MATMRERQREVQLYRGQMPSPGRPTVAWREDRVRFWAAIGRGAKTEEAAAVAGVSSPVAFRWFRHAGGVNPSLPRTVSVRYLPFSEREEIALFRAQGLGVREIARRLGRSPSTISRELRHGVLDCSSRCQPASWLDSRCSGASTDPTENAAPPAAPPSTTLLRNPRHFARHVRKLPGIFPRCTTSP